MAAESQREYFGLLTFLRAYFDAEVIMARYWYEQLAVTAIYIMTGLHWMVSFSKMRLKCKKMQIIQCVRSLNCSDCLTF